MTGCWFVGKSLLYDVIKVQYFVNTDLVVALINKQISLCIHELIHSSLKA